MLPIPTNDNFPDKSDFIFKECKSMKRVYERPMMFAQEFTANEYVAACGDSGKIYYFHCTAPAGFLYYYPEGDGNIDGKYTGEGKAQLLGSYNPCDAKHEASSTDDFYDGFVDYSRNWKYDTGEEVIVWRGPDDNNGHATANLNMSSWETAKS